MELSGLGKVIPEILRKFKGKTVAKSSGLPVTLNYLLIGKSKGGREHIKEGGGEKSQQI